MLLWCLSKQDGESLAKGSRAKKTRCYPRSLELKAQRSKRLSSPTFSFFDGFFILPTVETAYMLGRFTPTEDFWTEGHHLFLPESSQSTVFGSPWLTWRNGLRPRFSCHFATSLVVQESSDHAPVVDVKVADGWKPKKFSPSTRINLHPSNGYFKLRHLRFSWLIMAYIVIFISFNKNLQLTSILEYTDGISYHFTCLIHFPKKGYFSYFNWRCTQ